MKQSKSRKVSHTGKFRLRSLLPVVLGPILASPATTAFGQAQAGACAAPPAKAVSVQGTVETRRGGAGDWIPVKLNDTFCPGDVIRVQERSRADVSVLGQSVLRLNANSSITVEAPKEQTTGVVDLARGTAHFFSRGPRSLEVKTPFTIAGVRGTEFLVGVESDRTDLTVFEGTVVAQNTAGSLTLPGGQSAVARAGQAPVTRTVARPRDAVQWALYYPPVVYFAPDAFPAGSGWQGSVRSSMDAYAKGDTTRALAAVQNLPAEMNDPRVYAYRANLLLSVGRVDEARADIDRALKLAPNDGNALALQSVIAVTQGEKALALDTARKAVAAAPNSASAQLALSYAQQASFDLPGARASVDKAVQIEPNNALAWARKAEIESSFGNVDGTLAAAQKAATLDPNVSRTQAVLGFSHLTRAETGPAKAAFEKAIALDQGDPLPRLGLGLAKIREGDLEAGGRDVEVAASLDPNNALVRSYLGKTYYEEKRSPLDEREYAMAKQLDPKDPTPYFYDAIAKQTTNRPVEALQELEKARELNNNRSVYRSQLLLDSDDAARAASQARIYTDLGFQQRALVEGWNAVNTDPSNFSAHRFLADSYSVLPRHEIARVSELLQSQLLSPVTNTPLQPRLAESNLLLVSSGGPGTASFNEFNPLFTRNGLSFQLGGLLGSNDTWGGDVILSGVQDRFGFSIGYSRFKTDGFRTNADQDDKVGNVFLQFDFTPQTSAQFEYRHREIDRGDTALRFYPEAYNPGERNKEEWDTYRLGVRHAFSPGSILLGSLTYKDASFNFYQDQLGEPFTSVVLDRPEEAWSGEIQHIYRSSMFSLTSGIGYFDVTGKINSTVNLFIPPPDGPGDFSFEDSIKTDVQHWNAYVYGTFRPFESLAITGGLSYDSLDGEALDVKDKDSVNPKLGVVWNLTPSTTLRAAAFKTLKRTLVNDQTLEPTQVAGFNQFFDDPNGTEAWRYGVGVDQKFGSTVFVGGELTKRDVEAPFISIEDPENPTVETQNSDEYLGRAYAFWTPHPWWALSAQYVYEQQKVKDFTEITGLPEKLTTNRLPLGVRFFHPSGFGAGLTATYVDQKITFAGGSADSDKFWVVDAALSYRLPKRYGFVSFGATNLTDEEFRFYDTDRKNPSMQPDRMVYVRVSLSLP